MVITDVDAARFHYPVYRIDKGKFGPRLSAAIERGLACKPLSLATAHGTKGLEWDHVWIARSEESVVPDAKSTEPEERRLFYVAMTRARETLRISGTSKNFASRFVTEAQVEALQQAA